MNLPTLRRPATLTVARPAAVVMVACAAVHGAGAVLHWSPGLSLPTIGVAVGCLRCVPGLWSAPGVADWVWVTLGSAAMLVLHLGMLAQPVGSSDHTHAVTATGTSEPIDLLTGLGLTLPLMGLTIAWWALGSLRVGVPVDDHRPDRRRDG